MKDVVKNVVNQTKEVFKDRKKLTIIAGGIIVAIVIIVIAVILFFGPNSAKSQEEQLKDNIEALGREFYEDLYYPNTKNGDEKARAEFLSGFKDQGLKFDIDNLSRYEYKTEEMQNKLNSFVNEKTNEECDKKESKAIIYPTEPYGLKDYRIEIILVCGFDAE